MRLAGIIVIAWSLPLQPTLANSSRPVVLPDDGCGCKLEPTLPVCGNNSYTYANECQLECESQKRVQRGESPITVSAVEVCPEEGCVCPAAVMPVCGTDDHTYDNECRLSCISDREVRLGSDPIYVKSRDECPERPCPIDIIASCGSDGITYSSACLIERKNRERKRLGLPPIQRSPGACPSCICPAVIESVCGSDGQTYPNECELVCESDKQQKFGYPEITVQSQGECYDKGCFCPALNILPVCGSDGQTYSNECELDCASKRQQNNGGPPIIFVHRNPCNPPACQCPSIISPVCGTNNKSYKNICYLDCDNQINNNNGYPPISLKSYNICAEDSCICPVIWAPVCASNGNSYGTECALRCQNDVRFALGLAPLALLHKGECVDCVCNRIRAPVCGSDGVSYANLCELNCENARRKQRDLPPLKWIKGECGCYCPQVYRPVCASDMKTYGNKCTLGCENKKRSHTGLAPLTISWPGECGCHCTDFNSPVCGTDRRTYRNVCLLNCATFAYIRNGWPALYLQSNGPC